MKTNTIKRLITSLAAAAAITLAIGTGAQAATASEVLEQYLCSTTFTDESTKYVERAACKVYWRARITGEKDKFNALKACQATCSGSGSAIACMNTCSKHYHNLDR